MTSAPADAIGTVCGRAVPRSALEDRLRQLRDGPGSAALPAVGTREDRQLTRWAAHVVFTERLCVADRADRDHSDHAPDGGRRWHHLTPLESVQLGSITAAAWQGDPAVGALCAELFPRIPRPSRPEPSVRWRKVSHAVAPTEEDCRDAVLTSIGWTTLDDLPLGLATALRIAPLGVLVGPVASPLGWHVARVDDYAERPLPATDLDDGARLRSFTLWLDRRRAEAVRPAPGFEHPGDPRQPDNTHRH